MKDIEIFYDNVWSKASLTFLDLGLNIISPIKNKIIPYDDIKKITKCDDVIKIIYAKKIDIERKEIIVVIKATNEILEELQKKFTVEEEAKETVIVNSQKEEPITIEKKSPFYRLIQLLSLLFSVLFIIFGFNINKEKTVLGVYVSGNKYAPFLMAAFSFIVFISMTLYKGKKVKK